MFGQRKAFAAQTTTRLVRTPVDGDREPTIEDVRTGPEIAAAYSEIAKDFITHTAIVVTAAFSLCQIVKRVCR